MSAWMGIGLYYTKAGKGWVGGRVLKFKSTATVATANPGILDHMVDRTQGCAIEL